VAAGRVVIADDEPLIRGGVRMLLSGHEDIEVVGEASSGVEAVRQVRDTHADLVVMDLRMPGELDGVAATRVLTEDRADGSVTSVLALTMFNDDASVYDALRAGASGFLLKDSAPTHLVDAVRTVRSGGNWVDPAVLGQVIRALRTSPRAGTSTSELIARLTPREREVLVLIAQGASNDMIRQRLVVSEATVRTHVSRILMKTGCRDRAQAVVLAYQSRLVQP
jgi:DNA-binding NarL/FixJ family response regulator